MDPKQTVQRIADSELNELDINWRDYHWLVWWLVCREKEINANQAHAFEATHAEDEGVVDILMKLRIA
jgi:hypothetical protein